MNTTEHSQRCLRSPLTLIRCRLANLGIIFGLISGVAMAAASLPRQHGSRTIYHGNWRWGGQRQISPHRTRQIQAALVRAGYLNQISGQWDEATVAALRKFQAAHHWQTRFVPDARALIALNLGPRQDYRPGARALPALPVTTAMNRGRRHPGGASQKPEAVKPSIARQHK